MHEDLGGGLDAHCFEAMIFGETSATSTSPHFGKIALPVVNLRKRMEFGQRVAIAQFLKILPDAVRNPSHAFRGLQRPLRTDEKADADANMRVYSCKPEFDWIWGGRGDDAGPRKMAAPVGTVFAVTISPNIRHRDKYPQIDGWINHWTWIDEDPVLAEAPIDWADRYATKLWTKA